MLEELFLIAVTIIWIIGVICIVFIVGGDEE